MGICNATAEPGRALAATGSTAGPPAGAALLHVMPPDGERLFLQALGLEELFTAPAKHALKAAEEAVAARGRAQLTRSGEIDRRKLGSKRQSRSGHLNSAFKKARRWNDPAKSRWWDLYLDNMETFDEQGWHGRKFRRSFRVPRRLYEELVEEASAWPELRDEQQCPHPRPSSGPPCRCCHQHRRQPLRLKLLALLRIVGTACSFDDAAEPSSP